MTDQSDSLRADIAFLKALAEEGRSGPLVGGSVMLGSGLSFGSASLAQWAGGRFGWLTEGWQSGLIWLVAGLVCAAVIAGVHRGPQPRGRGPQAVGIAWSGAGFACFTIGLSLAVMAIRSGDLLVVATFAPFILSIYGACFFVAAAVSRARWLYVVTWASFALAVLNAWFATEGAVLYLVYALALYAVVAVPGLVLMRQARRAA